MWCNFFPLTPPVCEHSSIVYNVLDPSSLGLNHCGYSHIEICDDLLQHLTGNSPDLRLNVVRQRINSLGSVSTDPKPHILFVHVTTKVEICFVNEKNEVQEIRMVSDSLNDDFS